MATPLSTVITECRNELIDTGASPRWTDPEFLEWANCFFRELATLSPSSITERVTLPLVAGAFQSLPAEYAALVELTATASGRAIREVDYGGLKASVTFSLTESAAGPIEFARMTRSGGKFAVYPAVPSGGLSVTAMVVAPPNIDDVSDNVPLDDDLLPALFHYMIYRARSKDAEDTVMLARAQDAYAKCLNLLGVTGGSEAA